MFGNRYQGKRFWNNNKALFVLPLIATGDQLRCLQRFQFLRNNDPTCLNHFIFGLLDFLQDTTENSKTFTGKTSLRDNLAVDSITIAEMIFQLEDIFEIKIENQDLVEIRTIDELNSYIIDKLA